MGDAALGPLLDGLGDVPLPPHLNPLQLLPELLHLQRGHVGDLRHFDVERLLEGLVLLLGVVNFGQLLLALPGNLVLDLIQVLALVLLVRIFQSICVLSGLVTRSIQFCCLLTI